MDRLEGIASYLEHPLVLAGFVTFLLFGLYKYLVKKKILHPVDQDTNSRLVITLVKHGFLIALLIILLGFALEFYKEANKQENQRLYGYSNEEIMKIARDYELTSVAVEYLFEKLREEKVPPERLILKFEEIVIKIHNLEEKILALENENITIKNEIVREKLRDAAIFLSLGKLEKAKTVYTEATKELKNQLKHSVDTNSDGDNSHSLSPNDELLSTSTLISEKTKIAIARQENDTEESYVSLTEGRRLDSGWELSMSTKSDRHEFVIEYKVSAERLPKFYYAFAVSGMDKAKVPVDFKNIIANLKEIRREDVIFLIKNNDHSSYHIQKKSPLVLFLIASSEDIPVIKDKASIDPVLKLHVRGPTIYDGPLSYSGTASAKQRPGDIQPLACEYLTNKSDICVFNLE